MKNLSDAATVLAQTALMSAIVLSVFLTGSQLEGKLLPVASVQVTDGYWDGNDYIFEGNLRKHRACEFKGAYFRDRARKQEYRVKWPPRTSEANDDYSRPVGEDHFTNWRMLSPAPGSWVEAYAHHRCHDLWDTFSYLGSMWIPHKDST